MIRAVNYSVEIWTNSGKTSEEIGLVDGMYKWCIKSVDPLADYKGDILEDGGLPTMSRGCDVRTGGGIAPEKSLALKIVGSYYDTIDSTDSIIGKRIYVKQYAYTSGAWVTSTSFVGVVASVDMLGFTAVVNCATEGSRRDIDLPYDQTAFGEVAIDGTSSGDSGYIMTRGQKSVFVLTSAGMAGLPSIQFDGATPSVVDELADIRTEMMTKLNSGSNVYYVGSSGTHKITTVGVITDGGIVATLSEANSLDAILDEVGRDSVGSVMWSNEVYNEGIDGVLSVSVDGVNVSVDDVNGNVVAYKSGTAVDAGDGVVWRRLVSGVDYVAEKDIYEANEVAIEEINGLHGLTSGVYARQLYGAPNESLITFSGFDSATDWDNSTTSISLYASGADYPSALLSGFVFNMSGYRALGDRLYCVIHFEPDERWSLPPENYIRCYVTSYQDGTGIGEYPTGQPIYKNFFGWNDTVSNDIGTYDTMPSGFWDGDESQRSNFYNPAIEDTAQKELGGVVVDITDCVRETGGERYFDGVRIFVAVGASCRGNDTVGNAGIAHRIRQVNLVEGYEIGQEGLADAGITIDNAAENGAIPLAYNNIVKRQNLFGINATPPADGWGTEQVGTDGDGVAIDGNYVTTDVPDGTLAGVAGSQTASEIKKEIARSVPASSYYDRDGVESLLRIGEFGDSSEEIDFTDVVGDVQITGYSSRDIYPSLVFRFGKNELALQINHVEASGYDSSYVVDSVGLTDLQKNYLWDAGHALYLQYGSSDTQSTRSYPIVSDPDTAYNIAASLYANMGYVDGKYYRRSTISAEIKSGVDLDIGYFRYINWPQIRGHAVVSGVSYSAYGGTNKYTIEIIGDAETPIPDDILQTGDNTDDILETGDNTDNIFEGR